MLKYWIILSLILANGLAGAAMAPSRDQEKPVIPPDLRIEVKEVPAEENAIVEWRKAAVLEERADARLAESQSFCWKPGASKPSEADLDALRSWVRRNRDALKLFEASLKKPKAQWPENGLQKTQPEMRALADLTRARLVEAELLAEDQKFPEAVESLEKSLKLTQLGVEGDGRELHYVLSTSARTLVQLAMLRLGTQAELPVPLLERLLKDLPRLDSETNTFARIARVGLSRSMASDIDVRGLAERWSKVSITDRAMLIYPEELRRPLKVLLDPLLVAAHPKPFDEVTERKKDIFYTRVELTNSVSTWAKREDIIQEERDETIEKLKKDIEPLMELVKDEPLPLSKQAAERARGVYIQIENPIGRIFAGETPVISDGVARVFHCRTEREAIRALLGLNIFEREKGVLPLKFSDVVDAKILDSVPFDPFANAPLSYSRDRRIVWSVGQDGIDNGGESESQRNWYTGDAFWPVPKSN